MQTPEADQSWVPKGACYSQPHLTETFFPVAKKGPGGRIIYAAQVRVAQAICAECVVTRQCLEYAIVTNQEAGVWGGMDEGDRQDYRRAYLRSRVS